MRMRRAEREYTCNAQQRKIKTAFYGYLTKKQVSGIRTSQCARGEAEEKYAESAEEAQFWLITTIGRTEYR